MAFLPLFFIGLTFAAAWGILTEDEQILAKYQIVPQIIPVAPPARVIVTYSDAEVDMGNLLTPEQMQNQPNITWTTENGAYYTLIMSDHDIYPPIQHWVVVNIPGDDVSQGLPLFDYYGVRPAQTSSFHRFIFLVYKQNGQLDKAKFDSISDDKYESGRSYPFQDLLKIFQLTDPVAGNFFRA